MTAPLVSLEQVSPEWLTGRLRHNGYLTGGRVVGVSQTRVFSNNATSACLSLTYPAGDGETGPERLFVKVASPDFAWNHKEHQFYTEIAAEMQRRQPEVNWPFTRCYDAVYGGEGAGAHLLLEDLSASHRPADAPLPPLPEQAGQIVDGLAAFHAYWWESYRLSQLGPLHTRQSIAEMITWAGSNFRQWADYMGERLSSERYRLLEMVMAGWPARRVERLVQGEGITLVHRDTHPLNFLFPRDPGQDVARIVDWQSWRIDTGTDDLAYMMACHWYPAYRARWERPLLRRYHRQLVANGVNDYSWEACWYDYRASVIRCLFFLVGGWNDRRPAGMWWERVEKGLLAFDDLACSELF